MGANASSIEPDGTATSARAAPLLDGSPAFPMSFAQQRLWVLDRLLPRGEVYNVRRTLRLRGALDHKALNRALKELVRRHETLRTRFAVFEGEPVQVVEPPANVVVEFQDLSDLAPEERETQAEHRAQAEAQAPFDLERRPPLRTQLLRLTASEHWLLLTLHHIVIDGWSMGVLMRELSALYSAFHRGEASPLAELPVQYADYALWQREWLQGEPLEAQLGYWRRTLAELPVLELPTDRPRPAAASYGGARLHFELGEALCTALKALGRREGTTLFMTLFAAFQVLLYRTSNQEDFAVGVPVAGRSRPELEGLIGFFVNMLVMRADLSGAPSFIEVLSRVRARVLEAFAHQDVPFEKLVEVLGLKRELARNPLFQVTFTKRVIAGYEMSFAGLESVGIAESDNGTSKFDLAFDILERANKIEVMVDYATDLFDAATIERLTEHYRVLLEGVVADPQRKISQLPLLTEAERRQLLVEWNDTASEYPRERCIHELFEVQVERTPQAVALQYEGQSLTYRELNARANQLAHYLHSLGVGPEVIVGLCLERGLELVVGILGILKAGGAYVPLDPEYPAQRLAFMLEDTAAPVLLTQSHSRERLPAYHGRIVALDKDWPQIARQRENDPRVTTSPRSLAYVIYTSGSTGRPKGVCVEHRNVVRLVKDTHYVELGPREVLLQFAPISFDASTFELWGSLLNGARLVVCPAGRLSLQELGAVIREHGVTTLWLTAALFQQMVDTQLESLRGVRQLLAGGEALSAPHVRRMLDVIGNGQIINGYGPTENTTFTCCHVMRAGSVVGHSVPIGRPISNTQVYVLDNHRQPVPLGVRGELYIGGDGLAREYLHQPELTRQKFVPNPFSDDPHARLYRSGDLVRYLPEGSLEFLGRIDDQLKIRGFRIEPGEIESALGEHPAVRQAAVLARELRPGERTLVAYLVARDEQRLDFESLRRHLGSKLPAYMVPAHFVALPSLPLTPNGKIDRARLPTLQEATRPEPVDCRSPADQLERHLVKLWERVLGVHGVGTADDFFELGGHSLLAAQLFDEIERLFGHRLPLDTLWYQGATVSTLARLLRDDMRTIAWPILVPIKPSGIKSPLFVVHTMGGNLFHYDALAHALDPQQPVLGLQARGVYGGEQPRHRVEDVAADCVCAMYERQPVGPYLIAGYSSAGIVAFEIAQQLACAGREVGLLALIDSFSPRTQRKRSVLRAAIDMLGRPKRRFLQERVYHTLLHLISMPHWRRLQNIGESQRWAHWSYRARPYQGGACLFVANASLDLVHEPTLGWESLIRGGLRVRRLPGGHSSIVKAPLVNELAAALQVELDLASVAT